MDCTRRMIRRRTENSMTSEVIAGMSSGTRITAAIGRRGASHGVQTCIADNSWQRQQAGSWRARSAPVFRVRAQTGQSNGCGSLERRAAIRAVAVRQDRVRRARERTGRLVPARLPAQQLSVARRLRPARRRSSLCGGGFPRPRIHARSRRDKVARRMRRSRCSRRCSTRFRSRRSTSSRTTAAVPSRSCSSCAIRSAFARCC